MKVVLTDDAALEAMFGQEEIDKELEETTPEPEATDAPEVAPEATDVPDEVDPTIELKASIESLQTELVTVRTSLEAAETKVTDMEAELATVKEALAPMRGIVIEQVNRMRLALKLTKLDMSALDDTAVVREYEGMKTTFVKSFKVGSQIPENSGTKQGDKHQVSSLEASNVNALGFK